MSVFVFLCASINCKVDISVELGSKLIFDCVILLTYICLIKFVFHSGPRSRHCILICCEILGIMKMPAFIR